MMKALYQKKVNYPLRLDKIFFEGLIFLFFLFSSTERLNFHVFLFKGKVSNFISLFLFLFLLFRFKKIYLTKEVIKPLSLIFLSMTISTFFSYHPFRSFGYMIVYLIEVVFYFTLAANLCFFLPLKKLFFLYLNAFKCIGFYALSQLLLSFFGIYDPFISQFIGKYARPHAFCYEPSYYALYLVPFVAMTGVMYFCSDQHVRYRNTFILASFFYLLSTSTSCFFGYVFLLLITLILKKKYPISWETPTYFGKKFWSFIIAFLLSFIGFLLVAKDLIIVYFLKFFYLGLSHGSFTTRWNNSMYGINRFLENPIFGVGLGGIGPLSYARESGALVETVTELPLETIELYDSYNITSEVLGSLGLFGLISFAYFIFVFYRRFNLSFYLCKNSIEKLFVLSLFISLIMLICVLQFNPGLFRNYVWIHLGMCYGTFFRITRGKDISFQMNKSQKSPSY